MSDGRSGADTDSQRDRSVLPDLEPVRLLAPDGTRRHHRDYDVAVSGDDLVDLHRSLVVTRAVDREFVHLQRQGHLALYAPCEGQEAAAVGLARSLRPTDWVFVQYRELGLMLERGVDLGGIGRYWRGDWHAAWNPLECRLGPITVPIATHALHAAGYALGVRLDGGDEVVVACLGDGATSEGDAHEAMNFAAVFDTPTVFFVQNNQWAISTPTDEQHRAASFAHKALAYGMTGVRCDGNDILAVMAVVGHHAEAVRSGAAPVLIEAVTYRRGPHTTSDDPTRYRSSDDSAPWERLDPIDRLEAHLRRLDLWSDDVAATARTAAADRCAEVRAAVLDPGVVDPLEVFDHVFVDPPASLGHQAAELAAELDAAALPPSPTDLHGATNESRP